MGFQISSAFGRVEGGKKSQESINQVWPNGECSCLSLKDEVFYLCCLAKKMGATRAWVCNGLKVDGVVEHNNQLYLIEIKESMNWGAYTSALTQLLIGRVCLSDYIEREKMEYFNGVSEAALLIIFTCFGDWHGVAGGPWAQLSNEIKLARRALNSESIGAIMLDYSLGDPLLVSFSSE